MARVRIAKPKTDADIENEVAQLRGLDIDGLRSRWRSRFGGPAPEHLPKHLLFRILAYRVQADHYGDLDATSARLLDRLADSLAGETTRQGRHAKAMATLDAQTPALTPGTQLSREWNGQMHRVMVMADGFAWNGQTYPSLSMVAFAITGTRWNGPRFFGLRDKKKASPS
jgi:hypothetical protein